MDLVGFSAQDIRRGFGSRRVLDGVTLDVKAGSVFGLVGLNGAGKTTLIRTLLGLLRPEVGVCEVLGHDPSRQEQSFYRNIGVVLEHSGFWGNLNTSENLSFYAKAKGISRSEVDEYLAEFWPDEEVLLRKDKVKVLSRGQKMQGAICRAFLGWPRALFLDEPVVALDVRAYDQFCGLVRGARDRGASVLISSHQLDAIDELCDSVGMLENGIVHMIRRSPSSGTGRLWMIRTERSETAKHVISTIAQTVPRFQDNAWLFEISGDPKQVVSRIVSELSSSGLMIEEVRPAHQDLKDSIRQIYERKL